MSIEEKQEKVRKIAKVLTEIILFILVIFIIFEYYIYFTNNYSLKLFGNTLYEIEYLLVLQLVISVLIIFVINLISGIYIKKLDLDYIGNYLFLKDCNATLYLDSTTELISSNFKDEYSFRVRSEGCIRIKNEYNLDSPKYKCKLKKYYLQKSKRYRIKMRDGNYKTAYNFVTIDSIIEYAFELLDSNEFYPMLYHILSKKFIDLSILDNKVIIKLHLKDDISITETIDNIEMLYFEIIKVIGKNEEKIN